MDTYIFALLVCLSYIYRFRSDATINVVAASREACVGEDELIPWKYSNSSDTKNVIWSFTNSTVTNENVMVKVGSGNATVQNNFNIEHNGEGSVTLKAVSFVNEGIYKCAVSYTILSGHQAATGTTTVTILEPPSGLGYTDVDSVIKCTATSLGTPSASLYLKVNGKNVGVSAKVDSGKKAECCLNGKSVKCMTTASCVTVREPCCCWCWWGICYDCIGICFICWPPLILIVLYIVGIMIGIIWKKTNCCCKCFYHCKDSDCCECCQCCGRNTYVRCKCCASWPCGVFWNITQLPFWYQILWGTIIGIPVAFGIYTIWRCCGRAEKPGDSEQNEMDGEITKR